MVAIIGGDNCNTKPGVEGSPTILDISKARAKSQPGRTQRKNENDRIKRKSKDEDDQSKRKNTDENEQKDSRNRITKPEDSEQKDKIKGSSYLNVIWGVSGVILLVLFFVLCWWCCGWCRNKKSLAEQGYNLKARVVSNPQNKSDQDIFQKGEDLKIDIVNSTKSERNRFKEFEKLEVRVAERITLVKSTSTSQEEKNKKHNRYADIGKAYCILFIEFIDT
mgnify:CR=1 FL=1